MVTASTGQNSYERYCKRTGFLDMTEIYVFDFSKVKYRDLSEFIDSKKLIFQLPKEKREEIQSISSLSLRYMKLLATLFLRYQCANRTGLNDKQLFFRKNTLGKPYLSKTSLQTHFAQPHVHFSLSYTKDAFACAFSHAPVGVDIERLSPLTVLPARFLSCDEQSYCTNGCVSPSGENNPHKSCDFQRFYKIWTRKEAYSKMLGQGLAMDFASFSVLDPDISKGIFSWRVGQCMVSVSESI